MKRSPMSRKPSPKQVLELAARTKLKKQLIAEGPHDPAGVPLCAKCKGYPDFRGLQLIHLKSLGSGGKTSRANCRVWCGSCHFGPEGGHDHNEKDTRPMWSGKETT